MYGYGFPPPPYMYPFPIPEKSNGKKSAAVQLAKEILKQHKADKKRKVFEEKKKAEKNKPMAFSFLETTGLILFCSIPITLMQLWLLGYAQQTLSQAFAPH